MCPLCVSGNRSMKRKSCTRTFKHAAVVTDSETASDIGNQMLSRGGNAVDAAVATVLATGVVHVHSCGIGGGSLYIIYIKDKGWYAVDSRETAPQAANKNMFNQTSKNSSRLGGMAICIPGEVKGLYEVHKAFGQLPWKDVVQPTVNLCQNGVSLTSAVHDVFARVSQNMKEKFPEYFDEGNVKEVGTLIKLPRLVKTFQTIRDDPESFYKGSLAEDIVADIRDVGGIITLDDLKNYKVIWRDPSVMNLPGNISVYSVPPPGSGPVLGYILNILSGYGFSPDSIANEKSLIQTTHRILEAMKFAFAERSKLGDFDGVIDTVRNLQSPAYGEATRKKINDSLTHEFAYYDPSYQNNDDHGTSHISVIDAEGNAVSVTSTINLYFGCHVKGKRTGIVFNNEMDDFSIPDTPNYYGLYPSKANYIKPGKRPMSSMCPAIVFDNNTKKIKLVTGAAGGSTITTVIAMNIMDVLWFGRELSDSLDQPRLHHQLLPEKIQVEDGYPKVILQGLIDKGHKTGRMSGKSVIQAAEVRKDCIIAVADFRKGGVPKGY